MAQRRWLKPCTWKEKTIQNLKKQGNLLNVLSQIAIGGVVMNDSIDGAEEAFGP